MRFDELIKSLQALREILQKKHDESRNKYYGDNAPRHSKSRQEKASQEEKKNIEKLKQKIASLKKSNYKLGGVSQYNVADNVKRKARNVEENVIAGPNKNAKRWTTSGSSTEKARAANALRTEKKKMEQGTVKVMHPETKEMVTVSVKQARKWGQEKAKKNDELDPPFPLGKEEVTFNKCGQWKMKKAGFGTAVTAISGQSSGMPLGAANKAEAGPHAKPKFYYKKLKPENVKDVGAQGFVVELPEDEKQKKPKRPEKTKKPKSL